jgi:hypothetical protein
MNKLNARTIDEIDFFIKTKDEIKRANLLFA